MKSKWVIFVLFIIASCNSNKQEKEAEATSSTGSNDSISRNNIPAKPQTPVAHSFWDSISMQLELSDDQMAKYTVVDSIYYFVDSSDLEIFGERHFLGDTLYSYRNFKVAILNNYTNNCGNKFLLVFDSSGNKNLSYAIIEESCDRDGESEYSFLESKILSDSTFQTTEIDVPENADTDDKSVTRYVTKWKINSMGRIDTLPKTKARRK